MDEIAASVATCVASWLITICDPRSPSGENTGGFTKMWVGADGDSEPSTGAVTAAMASYDVSELSTRSRSCWELGTSTTSRSFHRGKTLRTSRTAWSASCRKARASSPSSG